MLNLRSAALLIIGTCLLCSTGCGPSTPTTADTLLSLNRNPSESATDSPIATGTAGEKQDWLCFRGPNFQSTTTAKLPKQWGMDEGIDWRTEIPGRGASTPIVVGDRAFVTSYSGYGLTMEDVDEFQNLRHHLLCYDLNSGDPIWHRVITGTRLKQEMNPELLQHGFASSTPVSDGENVYAFFGVTGVFAFDLDGNPLWQRNVGLNTHYFGSSASLVVHENLLIVNASLERGTVYALDKQTGSAVWKIPRVNQCWSLPVIGENSDGELEMVVSSKDKVRGFDPDTGEKLWECDGIQDYVVSVPVIVDGICYVSGGKQKQTMAIRLGGSGNVEATHKIWDKRRIGANVSSPVYRDGRLYIFHDNGIAQVIDAQSGNLVYRQRTSTRTRPFASPLLAGGYLYMPFQDAGIAIFQADEKCDEIAVMPAPDGLPILASIVPVGNDFLFRTDRYLYRVGHDSQATATIGWDTPSDTRVIETVESWNINPEKQASRRYLRFLNRNFNNTTKFLLMPYQSVITEAQSQQARDLIMERKPLYDALLQQLESLQWEEMQTPTHQLVSLVERYRALEQATNQLNKDTRIEVKKLFSEAQMEKHFRDAKAGVAHLPPGQSRPTDDSNSGQ